MLIDVINKRDCSVAEGLLWNLLYIQVLFNRSKFYEAMEAMKSKGLSAVSTIKDLLIAACDDSVLTDKTLSHLCDKHESLISLTQC